MARRSGTRLAAVATIDREHWREELPWLLGRDVDPAEADEIIADVERRVAILGPAEEVLLECDLIAEGRRGTA